MQFSSSISPTTIANITTINTPRSKSSFPLSELMTTILPLAFFSILHVWF